MRSFNHEIFNILCPLGKKINFGNSTELIIILSKKGLRQLSQHYKRFISNNKHLMTKTKYKLFYLIKLKQEKINH